MLCDVCHAPIFNHVETLGMPLTLPATGVAHQKCAARHLAKRRIFQGITLAELSDQALLDLKEMVRLELNVRQSESPLPNWGEIRKKSVNNCQNSGY